ncbi:hypothetical protein ABQE62_05670 [Mycolicibacterium fortuitum]
MDETSHHILTAEQRITQLQEQQLRWAESSPRLPTRCTRGAPAEMT